MNFENLDKFIFPNVGRYGLQQIELVVACPQGKFIPMNYADIVKDPSNKIVRCVVGNYINLRKTESY
jgi:hypothetical protein